MEDYLFHEDKNINRPQEVLCERPYYTRKSHG